MNDKTNLIKQKAKTFAVIISRVYIKQFQFKKQTNICKICSASSFSKWNFYYFLNCTENYNPNKNKCICWNYIILREDTFSVVVVLLPGSDVVVRNPGAGMFLWFTGHMIKNVVTHVTPSYLIIGLMKIFTVTWSDIEMNCNRNLLTQFALSRLGFVIFYFFRVFSVMLWIVEITSFFEVTKYRKHLTCLSAVIRNLLIH